MRRPTPAMFADDTRRWNAVAKRNRAADGAFVFGVRTTGVYCRPGCPSRLPKRANVRFFAEWSEAEQAGYRACKKCRPKAAVTQPANQEAIVRACRLIDQADEAPSLAELAEAAGLSRYYFHRRFKAVVGVTPKGYWAARQTKRLRQELSRLGGITQAILGAGFGSSGRCYAQAGESLGMTPGQLKNGAAGMRIRLAVARSPLGWVLVAATERGVCAIEFGDTRQALRERIAVRFPQAELADGDPEFSAWVAHVLSSIEAPGGGLDLPLDIQGTAFEQRVWKALQAIPAGTTASYAEVAARIGCPGAARAVGRACASNRLAVVIPCHRVIGSRGSLNGYRWGLERKHALLEREAR
ncbi:MAG: bifunctional DNA-binding transcriptional regulator/O6-methylguanine-DNA methyltransferase Ada [Pirellulales bacterium]